jgi:hypothetical protein
MRLRSLVALPAVVIAVACAGGAASSTPGSATAPTRQMNHISKEEIAASSAQFLNAYDLVVNLRPSMMRNRGAGTSTGQFVSTDVVAYFGEMKLGAVTALTSVSRAQILEIWYWGPSDATQKWGTNHPSGAIQVMPIR